MSKRHNVLQQIISKRWNTHKSNQMLTHNNNNNDNNNNNICTSKQIANSFFWYVFPNKRVLIRKVVWDVWGSRNYWSRFVTSDSNVVLLMFSTANNFYVLCSVLYSVIYIHIYVMHIIYIIPHTVMILMIISTYQNNCWCIEQSNSIYIMSFWMCLKPNNGILLVTKKNTWIALMALIRAGCHSYGNYGPLLLS